MKKNIQIIKPKKNWFDIDFVELFYYRDLIFFLVRRDFVTFYKQTILGPLWYLIQPLIQTILFTVIFGRLAQISTDGAEPFLFYMCGSVIWGYFSICVVNNSNTFISNINIFSKVYFPRLIVPISNVIISLVQFIIQFILLICFLLYFSLNGTPIDINLNIIFLPILLMHVALLSFGFGILFSSITTKYKDLKYVLTFGIQLWMFATPIVYPLSIVPKEYIWLAVLNPMAPVVEAFRSIVISSSELNLYHYSLSLIITILICFLGLILFSRIEKSFIDTI